MQSDIRKAALNLGFIAAEPVTCQPFDVWRNRLSGIPLGKYLSFEHDPSKAAGRPVEELTLWVAVTPTPPMSEWPEGCGEISGFYMCSEQRKKRRIAWEDAAEALGYEITRDVTLPERAAAIRAGLGVHGLNGLLITPSHGSFVDITLLLLHAAPPPGARGPEYDLSSGCGRCGECIKACPTHAISKDGVNTLMCLRHYMNRLEELPKEDYPKMERRILGCDTCQNACPNNSFPARACPPADIAEHMRLEELLTAPDIEGISKYIQPHYTRAREHLFTKQALLAAANTGRKDLLPLIETLRDSEDEVMKKMASWAAERLGQGV